MLELSKTDKLIHKWTGLLIKDWNDEIIEVQDVQDLFHETRDHLKEFCDTDLVPKSIARLIDVIWIFQENVLYDSHSLHRLHKEITDARIELFEAFFTSDYDTTDIDGYINKIRV